jgi:hypothetical protein
MKNIPFFDMSLNRNKFARTPTRLQCTSVAFLERFTTLDAFHADRRLNRVTLLAFHDQLGPAVLTVITEESRLTTHRAVDRKRKPTVAAPHPIRLDWSTTLGAPSLQRIHFPAHGSDLGVWRNQLTAILARLPVTRHRCPPQKFLTMIL